MLQNYSVMNSSMYAVVVYVISATIQRSYAVLVTSKKTLSAVRTGDKRQTLLLKCNLSKSGHQVSFQQVLDYHPAFPGQDPLSCEVSIQ